MSEKELLKGLTYLGTAYGKQYTKIELEQHYDFLKEYSYETFIVAIKSIIRKSKFLPKITELLEECENYKEQTKFEVIEFMKSQGYFKDIREYEKATSFMERGIIPEWLKNDINKYYKMMKQETLDHKETLMIGG
jgi:hypothetical protein